MENYVTEPISSRALSTRKIGARMVSQHQVLCFQILIPLDAVFPYPNPSPLLGRDPKSQRSVPHLLSGESTWKLSPVSSSAHLCNITHFPSLHLPATSSHNSVLNSVFTLPFGFSNPWFLSACSFPSYDSSLLATGKWGIKTTQKFKIYFNFSWRQISNIFIKVEPPCTQTHIHNQECTFDFVLSTFQPLHDILLLRVVWKQIPFIIPFCLQIF